MLEKTTSPPEWHFTITWPWSRLCRHHDDVLPGGGAILFPVGKNNMVASRSLSTIQFSQQITPVKKIPRKIFSLKIPIDKGKYGHDYFYLIGQLLY